jgi:hypothetical protein
MKKLILLTALVVTVSMAHAQRGEKSPEQRAARFTKILTKTLNLSTDQATQVNAIFLTQATRVDSLKNNRSPDVRLNQLTMKTILLATHLHVMAILNDSQKQQYTEWENSLKERQKAKQQPIGARE